MPTGNLPAQAESLHVSREAIYLSITLFVVGFGVGPLAFAPGEFSWSQCICNDLRPSL
jgi:hypothetical protein